MQPSLPNSSNPSRDAQLSLKCRQYPPDLDLTGRFKRNDSHTLREKTRLLSILRVACQYPTPTRVYAVSFPS